MVNTTDHPERGADRMLERDVDSRRKTTGKDMEDGKARETPCLQEWGRSLLKQNRLSARNREYSAESLCGSVAA